MRICSGMWIAALAAGAALCQPVPKLANGKPDLSGVWDHPRVGDMSKDVSGRCVGGTMGCRLNRYVAGA